MSYPLWFALPPEVHSTLLSAGPGPGPLLAAAGAWQTLAAEYTAATTELTGLLTAVQAAAWAGPTAERFVAAHQPFLSWLAEASAVATRAATGHETAATGYTAALAEMPTIAELAANHAVHAVLLATNFFGINTIPIAINEADYTRMWIQAAATMSVYQSVSEESLAATPAASPAPHIVTAEATSAADSSIPDPTQVILQLFADFLSALGNLAVKYLPGPLGGLVSQVLDAFIAFMSTQLFLVPAYSVLDPLIYFGPFTPLLGLLTPIGLVGLTGLAALGESSPPLDAGVRSGAPGRQTWPATTGAAFPSSAPAVSAAAPAGTSPASSPATTAPAAPGPGAAQGFYAISNDPDGEGFSPAATTKATATVTASTAVPTAAALAASRGQTRAKRAAKTHQRVRKYRFEYLEDREHMTLPADPTAGHVTASDSDLGTLGFAGTLPKSVATQSTGIARLGSGEFGQSPRVPMLPHTWDVGHGGETVAEPASAENGTGHHDPA